jgi:hypothetical protein
MKKLVNDIYEENKKIKEKFSKRKWSKLRVIFIQIILILNEFDFSTSVLHPVPETRFIKTAGSAFDLGER